MPYLRTLIIIFFFKEVCFYLPLLFSPLICILFKEKNDKIELKFCVVLVTEVSGFAVQEKGADI